MKLVRLLKSGQSRRNRCDYPFGRVIQHDLKLLDLNLSFVLGFAETLQEHFSSGYMELDKLFWRGPKSQLKYNTFLI